MKTDLEKEIQRWYDAILAFGKKLTETLKPLFQAIHKACQKIWEICWEEFGNLSSSFSFEFEGNVLVIDSLHDMDKLPVCARLLRQVNTSVMPQRKGEYHGSIGSI